MEQLGEPSRFFREPTQSYSVQASFVVKEAGTGDEGTHLVEVGSFTHKRGAVLLCRIAMAGISSQLSINRISRSPLGVFVLYSSKRLIAAWGLSATNIIGRLSRVVLSGYCSDMARVFGRLSDACSVFGRHFDAASAFGQHSDAPVI